MTYPNGSATESILIAYRLWSDCEFQPAHCNDVTGESAVLTAAVLTELQALGSSVLHAHKADRGAGERSVAYIYSNSISPPINRHTVKVNRPCTHLWALASYCY